MDDNSNSIKNPPAFVIEQYWEFDGKTHDVSRAKLESQLTEADLKTLTTSVIRHYKTLPSFVKAELRNYILGKVE